MTDTSTIARRVEFMAALGHMFEAPNSSFSTPLSELWDSLEYLDAITRVEDHFGVIIPNQVISGFMTMGDIACWLEEAKT